jgi:hypothetical protein
LRFSGRLRVIIATPESWPSWIVLYSIIVAVFSEYAFLLRFVILSEAHRFVHDTMRTVEGFL